MDLPLARPIAVALDGLLAFAAVVAFATERVDDLPSTSSTIKCRARRTRSLQPAAVPKSPHQSAKLRARAPAQLLGVKLRFGSS